MTPEGAGATAIFWQADNRLCRDGIPSPRCEREGDRTPAGLHTRRPAPGRSSPQEQRVTGISTRASGVSTARRVSPLCPGCPPGFFPDGVQRLLGAGFRYPSLEGRLELLFESFFICRSSSLMRASFSIRRASLSAIQESAPLSSSWVISETIFFVIPSRRDWSRWISN